MTKFQLRGLILSWPVALALAVTLIATALGLIPASAQTAGGLEGTLHVIWGDPRPGTSGGATLFKLTTPDGTTYPLQIGADQQTTAMQYFMKRVVVQGRTADSSPGSTITVDQITLAEPPNDQVQPQVLVTRRVLYILVKYKSDTQTPHLPSFFKNLTNPLTPPAGSGVVATINGYYNKTSWNQLKWLADVAGVGGLNPTLWLTLPKTKAGYANCGWNGVCADLDALAKDAMDLAVAAGVNVTVYKNINIVVNNDLDCCAWGGSFTYGAKNYSATWEPPWAQEAGTYVHELGHSIGLPHSGWVYEAYDSPWDDMSNGSAAKSVNCGTYKSANSGNVNEAITCTEPGAGYITAHKDALGWIPLANQKVISAKTVAAGVNIVLTPNSGPLAGIKMVKICLLGFSCTGPAARFITVEGRVKTLQYEKGLTFEGVIIHDVKKNRAPIGGTCFFNNQSGWAVPIDATPNDFNKVACNPGGRTWPNYGLGNAQFGVGKTYTNAALGVVVKVVSRAVNNFTVNVKRTK